MTSNTPRFDVELEVLESDYLEPAKKFMIKASGFINNTKLSNQGRVYIGSEMVSRQDFDVSIFFLIIYTINTNSVISLH